MYNDDFLLFPEVTIGAQWHYDSGSNSIRLQGLKSWLEENGFENLREAHSVGTESDIALRKL